MRYTGRTGAMRRPNTGQAGKTMEKQTVLAMLETAVSKYGKDPYAFRKPDAGWEALSFAQVREPHAMLGQQTFVNARARVEMDEMRPPAEALRAPTEEPVQAGPTQQRHAKPRGKQRR